MKKPKILICITSKNDALHLDKFLKEMENLDYPKENLRWVWMYGKSVDFTLQKILDFHKNHTYKYEIYEEPLFYNITRSSMWIADVCNAFKKTIQDEDFVLFPDTDICRIPKDTLTRLVEANKDVIAPYVWIDGTKPIRFFDTYAFRVKKQPYGRVVLEGKNYNAWNPPFKESKVPVKMDSVGTFILIRAEVFRQVSWENPAPHFQFCKNARKAGFTVWSLPSVNIYHANIERTEKLHGSIEYFVATGVLDRSVLAKMKDDAP